ncbi:phosphatidylethanolamine-binding protein [Geotalea daltonii FRC-32]|uniref:Phosphatidylethanolamine-binding protein n=1 Tax=Geotalea daltonii (strain DSM 22248 / JCM 15807 / FRC-32) TaxID=316067 RepID=B9LYX1_GEODF|nr:YbhB/YbcL family Raf kinase inhibitor-like protein [Geotalea daltonii]ACM18703.1 phosphatidylethanolamine-binding protein [Geotalea daltonii FRC-32]
MEKILAAMMIILACTALAIAGGAKKGGMKMKISSPAFTDSQSIPDRYTCNGNNISPPLRFENIPARAKSLALIVDDPDAPAGTWTHWIVWNMSPRTRELAENAAPREAIVGKNDFYHNSYGGPCPPSGTHRYFFRLYALDAVLQTAGHATRAELEKALQPHIIETAELMGTYQKK